MRTAFDLGALRATGFNSALRPFYKCLLVYKCLLAAGRSMKGALVACMHKLLTILNARLKHHAPGRPSRLRLPGADTRRHGCSAVLLSTRFRKIGLSTFGVGASLDHSIRLP